MKTPITILLLALTLTFYSQNPPMLNVWLITPSVVCPGDSFKLNYKITDPNINSTVTAVDIPIDAPLLSLWKGSYTLLKQRPKEAWPQITGDSTYYIYLKIPLNRA